MENIKKIMIETINNSNASSPIDLISNLISVLIAITHQEGVRTPKEPRLLTYEEAINAEYCVMEVRETPYIHPRTGETISLRNEFHQFVHGMRGTYGEEQNAYFSPSLCNSNMPWFDELVQREEYNKKFRCWSAIPLEEQVNATPWED